MDRGRCPAGRTRGYRRRNLETRPAREAIAHTVETLGHLRCHGDAAQLHVTAAFAGGPALFNQHLKRYPPGPDGRVFTGPRGIFNDRAYLKIFHKARAAALTASESASLLARRPYDLRHAAVSTWLNAGVPAPQVADWVGPQR
jgi:integrase